MALITELPASTTLAATDVVIKDTGTTTQKMTAQNFADSLAEIQSSSITSYNPTVTLSSGTTVDNVNFAYRKVGKLYIIGGRFRVLSATSTNLTITYPDGITVPSGGSVPFGVLLRANGEAYPVRAVAANLYISNTGGSTNSVPFVSNEYVSVFAVVSGSMS